MNFKNVKIYSFSAIAASLVMLGACGGGGGGDESNSTSGPKPEGAYSGTVTGSSSNAFDLVVLENNEYWSLYGNRVGGKLYVNGFIQGRGQSNNGSFSSSNAKDFGFNPAVSGSLTSIYQAGKSIQGTVSAGGKTLGFNGAAIPAETFDYNSPASLSQISGRWSMTSIGGAPAGLNISTNGNFAGSSEGCNFSGTLTPRASGKNIFNFAVNFGGYPCILANQSAGGIAITNLVNGGAARQLIVIGADASRTVGTALFGSR